MKNLLAGFLSIVFPPQCVLCGDPPGEESSPGPLCASCAAGLRPVRGAACAVCGAPAPGGERCGPCTARTPPYSRVRAAARYEGRVRECVLALKYGRRRGLARPLARLMVEAIAGEREAWACDLVVPVPLDRLRRRERGFDQAADLARELGRALGMPVAVGLLRRVRAVPPQTTLGRAERLRNVRGAFAAPRREALEGRRVLLVDDVFTSGATAAECAAVLRGAGAREVLVMTAARTP